MNRDFKMKKINNKINEDDVVSLESEIGFTIPDNFRLWLSNTNGGWPEKDFVGVKNFEDPAINICQFNSIQEILDFKTIYKEKLPSNWIPIGRSLGGDPTVIDVCSEKIYYIPLEVLFNNYSVNESTSLKIANSFSKLLERMNKFEVFYHN